MEAVSSDASKMFASAALVSGKVSFLQIKFTTPAGAANGDKILFGYLPSGMTVVPALSSIEITANAGTATIDIGIQGSSADSIAANLDVSGATTKLLTADDPNTSSPYVTTVERAVIEGTYAAGGSNGAVAIYLNLFLVNSN